MHAQLLGDRAVTTSNGQMRMEEGAEDSLQEVSQGTKIFQYCTCPAGRVTYNFHSSYKHMNLSFKSICNKEHKGII